MALSPWGKRIAWTLSIPCGLALAGWAGVAVAERRLDAEIEQEIALLGGMGVRVQPIREEEDAGPTYRKMFKNLTQASRTWTVSDQGDQDAGLKEIEAASRLPAALYSAKENSGRNPWDTEEVYVDGYLANLRAMAVATGNLKRAERITQIAERVEAQRIVGDSPSERAALPYGVGMYRSTFGSPEFLDKDGRAWLRFHAESLDLKVTIRAELSQVALSARRWLDDEPPPPAPPIALGTSSFIIHTGGTGSYRMLSPSTPLPAPPAPTSSTPPPPAWRRWLGGHPTFKKWTELSLLRALRKMAQSALARPGFMKDYHRELLDTLDRDGSLAAQWARLREEDAGHHFVTGKAGSMDIDRRIQLIQLDLAERPNATETKLTWSKPFAVDPLSGNPLTLKSEGISLTVQGDSWMRLIHRSSMYPLRVISLHKPPTIASPKKFKKK